jgi:hypothetical protein
VLCAVCFVMAGLAGASMPESEVLLPVDFKQAGNTAFMHVKSSNHGLNSRQAGSRHLLEDDSWDDGGHAVVEQVQSGAKTVTAEAGSKQADKDIKAEDKNAKVIKSDETITSGALEQKAGALSSGVSPPTPAELSRSENSDVKRNDGAHVGVSRHLNASEEEKDGGEDGGVWLFDIHTCMHMCRIHTYIHAYTFVLYILCVFMCMRHDACMQYKETIDVDMSDCLFMCVCVCVCFCVCFPACVKKNIGGER